MYMSVSTKSIAHICICCSYSLAMWNEFSTHMYNTTSERIGFNTSNVIFGDCPLLDTSMTTTSIHFLLY